MSPRVFTVREVNELLPRLRRAVKILVSGSKRLENLAGELYGEQPESDTAVDPDYADAVLRVQQGVEAVQKLGGEVKDLKQGLVDFRSTKEGREVYLCWLPGEHRVAFWHEMHAGFAGRTAITDEDAFGTDDPGSGGDGDDEPDGGGVQTRDAD